MGPASANLYSALVQASRGSGCARAHNIGFKFNAARPTLRSQLPSQVLQPFAFGNTNVQRFQRGRFLNDTFSFT